MTLDEYLADLAAKAEKATPGPWEPRTLMVFAPDVRLAIAHTGLGIRPPSRNEGCETDAAHIAAFSPDVAAALVAVAEAAYRWSDATDNSREQVRAGDDVCDALARLTALARTR